MWCNCVFASLNWKLSCQRNALLQSFWLRYTGGLKRVCCVVSREKAKEKLNDIMWIRNISICSDAWPQFWAGGTPQADLLLCLWAMMWCIRTVNSSRPHTHTHTNSDNTPVGWNEWPHCFLFFILFFFADAWLNLSCVFLHRKKAQTCPTEVRRNPSFSPYL